MVYGNSWEKEFEKAINPLTANEGIWIEEFDKVEPFYKQYGIYIVSKSGKMGVIKSCDNHPEIIVPIEYDQIKVVFKDVHLLLAKKNEKYRLIRIKKNIQIFSPYYDKIGPFGHEFARLAPVYIGHLLGVVNADAEEIIPVQYKPFDDMPYFKFPYDALLMKKDSKFGVFKTSGKLLLPFEFERINYNRPFYRVPESKTNNNIGVNDTCFRTALIPVKRNKKWGLVDCFFKEVVPCVYQSIRQSSKNKLMLTEENGYDLLSMTTNGVKITNIIIEKADNYSKVERFVDGLAKVEKDGKCGYIDEMYKEVIPCVFDEVFPFVGDVAMVKKGGKYGCVDKKGRMIIHCLYDQSINFFRGVAVVERDGKMGAINEKGEVIVPVEYTILADFSCVGPTLLLAVKDKSIGVIDKNNNTIVPFDNDYDDVLPAFGMISLSKKKKKGVYNYKGQQIVPFEYDDIQHPFMTSTSINVCINGKWGVLNKKGEEICSPKYDKIDDYGFACGRLAVCREGKWGFINWKGREVIDCIYDEVFQFFEENHCEVKLNGKKMTIDVYGNRITI